MLLVARRPATRLVVFVHGFNGHPLDAWADFDDTDDSPSWARTDLLFVGYAASTHGVLSVVHRIRNFLPTVYPLLSDAYRMSPRIPIREPSGPYRELVITGHSLGGLIVRRLVADVANTWLKTIGRVSEEEWRSAEVRPSILDAKTVLFSPASEGFQPTGWLGVLDAAGVVRLTEVRLKKAQAYSDLQPSSQVIKNTRELTNDLVRRMPAELTALVPFVLPGRIRTMLFRWKSTGPTVNQTLPMARLTHRSANRTCRTRDPVKSLRAGISDDYIFGRSPQRPCVH